MSITTVEKINFFIVGAPKCGTTALYEYLRTNDDVFLPASKEPNYFSYNPEGIHDLNEYLSIFKNSKNEKIIGEASTSYLMDNGAPLKIKELCSHDTKIIAILRNPVEMSFSLWRHMKRECREDLSFMEAVASQNKRKMDSNYVTQGIHRFLYTERAMYSEQVLRYLEAFGEKNILILVYEEFFRNPSAHFKSVCKFLCIKNHNPSFVAYNQSGDPRSSLLQKAILPGHFPSRFAKNFFDKSTRSKIRKFLNKINIRHSENVNNKEGRLFLKDFFYDDIKKLEEICNFSLKGIWY